jgi:NAD(P)-dependent dehydrogenase (short-subunit alcohol dehydrogenase family)
MKFSRQPYSGSGFRAYVCGAKQGSGNIGEAIAERFHSAGWATIQDDCAMNDEQGARPPGGNIPTPEVAREHGYSEDERGHYQWYDAPPVSVFEKADADALIVTLGATYKGHFAEITDGDISRILRACLELPLRCARRYVQATEQKWPPSPSQGPADRIRHIIFVGSYAHDHPFTNGTLYCAAKAGLDMAARTLGWELTDRGYRIHIVHPYHVQGTPMWAQVEQDVMRTKGMTYEEADAYNRKDLKMPDLLRPEEVAEVVYNLVHLPAFGWLSGQPINLYGGSR